MSVEVKKTINVGCDLWKHQHLTPDDRNTCAQLPYKQCKQGINDFVTKSEEFNTFMEVVKEMKGFPCLNAHLVVLICLMQEIPHSQGRIIEACICTAIK